MWPYSIRAVRVAIAVSTVCVAVTAAGCVGESATTTAEETSTIVDGGSTTAPGWSAEDQGELQARAMRRAWDDYSRAGSVCVSTDIPSEVQAALEDVFGDQVEYFEAGEDPYAEWPCNLLVVRQVERLSADVVRISAGVIWGPTSGNGVWYYFRWDGTAWVDGEPDPGDITGQTGWAS